jgi:hypothetical protein
MSAVDYAAMSAERLPAVAVATRDLRTRPDFIAPAPHSMDGRPA